MAKLKWLLGVLLAWLAAVPGLAMVLCPVLYWASLVAVFPVVGLLTGWLVGASQTPVVGTMLPLVFGLMGALTYGLLDRANKIQSITDRLKAELDPSSFFKAQTVIKEESTTSMGLAGFWGLGVVLFCAGCYYGVQRGIDLRAQPYPSMNELVGTIDASPEELALLYSLRLHLITQNTPVEETRAIFKECISPVFALKPPVELKPTRGKQSMPATSTLPDKVGDIGLQLDPKEVFYSLTRPQLVKEVVSNIIGVKRETQPSYPGPGLRYK